MRHVVVGMAPSGGRVRLPMPRAGGSGHPGVGSWCVLISIYVEEGKVVDLLCVLRVIRSFFPGIVFLKALLY